MSTARWALPGIVITLLLASCTPDVLTMNLGNPARGGNVDGAMQSYEVPPFRQDHQYEVTLQRWTPTALAFKIHLVNADRCGLPSSYSFQLVDDQGRRYAFQPASVPEDHVVHGHMGATLHEDTTAGTFPVAVGAGTRFVVLQIRPQADRGCTSVDFRWAFGS